MTDYNKTVDFAAKDGLSSGDPDKLVKGTEHDTEYNNIALGINSKPNANNGIHTGTSVFTNIDASGTGNFGGSLVAEDELHALDRFYVGAGGALGTFFQHEYVDPTHFKMNIKADYLGAIQPICTIDSGGEMIWNNGDIIITIGDFKTLSGDVDVSGSVNTTNVVATGYQWWDDGIYRHRMSQTGTTFTHAYDDNGALAVCYTIDSGGQVDFGGNVTIPSLTAESIFLNDNDEIWLGTSGDSKMFFNAVNTELELVAGNFVVTNGTTTIMEVDEANERLLGAHNGTATATGDGYFETVTALPGSPDANCIYFVVP